MPHLITALLLCLAYSMITLASDSDQGLATCPDKDLVGNVVLDSAPSPYTLDGILCDYGPLTRNCEYFQGGLFTSGNSDCPKSAIGNPNYHPENDNKTYLLCPDKEDGGAPLSQQETNLNYDFSGGITCYYNTTGSIAFGDLCMYYSNGTIITERSYDNCSAITTLLDAFGNEKQGIEIQPQTSSSSDYDHSISQSDPSADSAVGSSSSVSGSISNANTGSTLAGAANDPGSSEDSDDNSELYARIIVGLLGGNVLIMLCIVGLGVALYKRRAGKEGRYTPVHVHSRDLESSEAKSAFPGSTKYDNDSKDALAGGYEYRD